jgi:hypothetical protein
MRGTTARTVAQVVLVRGGGAAACVVGTPPPLRRLALRATRLWLGASVPAFLLQEVGRAWVESGRGA